MLRPSIALALAAATLPPGAQTAFAAPLWVDLDTHGRSDMRSEGWESWAPSGSGAAATFGGVAVALRAADGSALQRIGGKALVAGGLTVGADGVMVGGDGPAALELELRGLTPGRHRFVGFHHWPDRPQPMGIACGARTGDPFVSSTEASHDDELGTSYLEFEVAADAPAVIRIGAGPGGTALLNGFALDVADPRKKALKPQPPHLDHHADGDGGTVALAWQPAPGAVSHRVHIAADRDPAAAARALAAAGPLGETAGHTFRAAVTRDSLLHYCWRVDSIDRTGAVTRGDPWRFRVRQPAFPGAEGYGRFAIGGRGGRVIHVTSLADSGPGSLRAAVEATGPRTVVFDVSGLITLESKLLFRGDNAFLTVAGQTAPGKGICLRGYSFGGLGARDTVVRFIRLRLGDLSGETMDGMGLAGADHCIIDHCSISWSIDEAFSSRGAKNITLQRCLISEALNVAGHRKYGEGAAHGYAASIGGEVGSFHHNLLAHNAGRNWSLAGGIDQANRHAGRLDLRNNVVYNWHSRTTDGGARQVQFVGNYYKPGPASRPLGYLNPQFENPAFGPQQYYVEGNRTEGAFGPEGPLPPLAGVRPRGEQAAPVTVATPFFAHHVTTQGADEAFGDVLADVGCNVPALDEHDTRVVRETRTGTATFRGSKSGLPGLPDSQADVGGWEHYPEIRRPEGWDIDRDGMPDRWERARGLDPADPGDGAGDPDGDGYTNLEDYLNALAAGGG